jgi:1-acyl-sn-glycerol-3-phosphate acyltransferase
VTDSGLRRLPLAYRVVVVIVRPLLMLLTKRDWQGVENLPRRGGFVVCPNHLSYVEPFTFAHFMYDSGREVYYLAKESVFRIPVVGAIIRGAQQIPVYRNSGQAAEAFRAAVAAIEDQGKCVGVYPDPLPGHPGRAVGAAGGPRALLQVGPVVSPQDDARAGGQAGRARGPLRQAGHDNGAA